MNIDPEIVKEDSIAALATAVGGAIAVIRASGPQILDVAEKSLSLKTPLSEPPFRMFRLGNVISEDNEVIDQVMAVFMPGPNSFTGEDMVEIHCHGGALGARLVLMRLLDCGARHADPGEFTKRAFINGKMDLTQAEAVSDMITAHTEMALKLANRQLDGLLGRKIGELYNSLEEILSEIESRLDFPDEDLDWTPADTLKTKYQSAIEQIQHLLNSRREGEILRSGVRMVLAGEPNVGKSSLMNAILGRDRAIVTHIPGTTRDTLEELAHVRGIPLNIVDTAGIRDSDDPVEKIGIERSRAGLKQAQVILWLFDGSASSAPENAPEFPTGASVLYIANKIDLASKKPVPECNDRPVISVSATSGTGIEVLFDAIERAVWERPHDADPQIAVSSRHAELLEKAAVDVLDAKERTNLEELELGAISLHSALEAIGRINGRTAAPDILDSIFSKFCIGK